MATKRVKRSDAFELTLLIKDDGFIRPPTDAQRNALLNRSVKEFTEDLNGLDRQARRFVAGETAPTMLQDRTQCRLSDAEIMEDWQIPILHAMADAVCATRGDVLEVGFGRGLSATMIQQQQVRSHTVIECNDSVVAQPGRVHGVCARQRDLC